MIYYVLDFLLFITSLFRTISTLASYIDSSQNVKAFWKGRKPKMNNEIKIGVIGGDTRQLVAAHELAEAGFRVECFGVPKKQGRYGEILHSPSLEDCVAGASAVVLGVPFSRDDRWVNCPYGECAVSIKSLLECMLPGQLLLGGRLSEELYGKAEKYCIDAIDYFEVESLSVENAIPTAEGALAVAMQELDVTIHGSSALVTGYGRVGKVMAKTLHALGAQVTVAARKSSVGAWCRVNGYGYCTVSDISDNCYDVIFNTVPFPLFNRELLQKLKKDTLIIDLASTPGGVDMAAAKELDVRVIRALSLPGKVAPVTAGRIIKDTVQEILSGEGIV